MRPLKLSTRAWWTLSLVWLIAACGAGFLWKLGATGLVDETEPLFAEAARQMAITGDWITPYFNEATRFDKPPLIYWLMAIAYQVGGVSAWTARLPSALAAVGLTLMGFYTLLRFGVAGRPAAAPDRAGERSNQPAPREEYHWGTALAGASALALNLQTVVWGRTGVSDMLLSSCMGSALFAFFLGYSQPERPGVQRGWFTAFYVLVALAILTKGPVGLVLPGLIIVSFLGYLGSWRSLREMRPLLGLALVLGVTLPWYLLVIRANGQAYIDSFFGYHNVQRFTQVVNNHSAPGYFYFLVVLVGFIPWSMYLPWGIARLGVWQRRQWQQQPRHRQLGLFALVWFTVVFVFFTLAVTKLPSYTLPLLPAAAVLIAPVGRLRQGLSKGWRISGWANALFLLLLAGVLWRSAPWMGNDPAMPNLSEAIAASRVLWWGALGWLAAAALSALATWRRSPRLWWSNALGFIAFLLLTLLPALTLVDNQRQRPLRQLAATIAAAPPQEAVVMVGFKKPSLVFYAQRPVTYIYTPAKAIAHLRRGRDMALPTALLVGQPAEISRRLAPDQYDILAEAGTYRLVRVYRSRL
ncbi:MAG: ArnT family glycosyltransferase [Elainellaceae cyanobacterium]